MKKPLIAGLTALSLTLAAALPAQAAGTDRETAAKVLLGLAAVAVVGAAINNDRNEGSTIQVDNRRQWNNNDWSRLNRNNRRELPASCLRNVPTRFGTYRIFGQRCLQRNYAHVDRLPSQCAVRVYSTNGPRRGFDPRCLRQEGYRSDRRR